MDINNKYHNGKIYQITDIGYNKYYIGSTTEELSQIIARHRTNYKSFLKHGKKFMSSFDLFSEYGVENCKIELIEYFKCDTLQELRKREGEVIKNTECVNKCVAGRTEKEWREDNKDKIREDDKIRHAKNKDEIKERKKEYYQNNKDKILVDKREYREANKDRSELAKQYYEANKEKIKEKTKQRSREQRRLKKEMKEHNLNKA